MEQYNVRNYACEILTRVLEQGCYTNLALSDALNTYAWMTDREKRFLTRLVEGTVERCIHIDWVLDSVSSVKVRKMKPFIRTILRMSVYQILYMDSVPSYSAVNEAVKLVQKSSFRNLRGFVNAILRRIASGEGIPTETEPVWAANCVPQWLYEMWVRDLGPEETSKVCAAYLDDDRNTVTIRRRITGQTEEEFEAVIAAEGLQAEPLIPEYGVYTLVNPGDLRESEAFRQGLFYVQDASSVTAGFCAHPEKDSLCVDVCAAPGGKSILLADLMGGTGKVLSRDLEDSKAPLVYEAIDRSGFENIEFEVRDASVPDPKLTGRADLVLADLPCSGLGVLKKKPDIRYHATEQGCKDLADLQRKILSVVQAYVKHGGTLLYSTCTIDRMENEENRQWFLEHFPFEPSPFDSDLPAALKERTEGMSELTLLPGDWPGDGFYFARFRRKTDGKN